MIEAIANDVLSKLDITPPEDFEDFVGMEDHITKMSVLLDLESEEVRMVGIWGTSGIGKTSIARVFYTRLRHHFQANIFIDRAFVSSSTEIYKNSNSDDYNKRLHLLRSFLSKILDIKDIRIYSLSEMGGRLKNKKVLIFVDDLDDQMVLETLVGQTHWFGRGSRIIVVTKDKKCLRAHKIDHIYNVPLPSKMLALQMLCIYIFKQNAPPEDMKEFASEVAALAGNLPLGLKLLGSLIRATDKDDWMDMLPSLHNSLDGEIEKTLRVSYDGLKNRKYQTIFRHIACLFNGEKLNDIELLLADSDLDVKIGLKNLVDQSLIHVRYGNVEMHCLLEDMGKEIVRKQSNEPGEREFLADSEEICEVFKYNTGTKSVLGIALDMDKVDKLHIHENAFKGMRNVFFLNLYSKKKQVRWHLLEGFQYFPSKLRLLRVDGYPMKHIPSDFRPENLIKLQMEGSKLEKLWDGVQILKSLKEINLSRSKKLKEIPDLSMATNLKEVYLEDCSSLVELSSSIRYLNKLEKLLMSGCKNLEILPTGINLQSLERVELNYCSKLKHFPDISTNLNAVYLEDCSSLIEIPSSIKYLNKLVTLIMSGCTNLETLPTGINLPSLQRLELERCSKLKNFFDISTNIFQRYLSETSIEEFCSTLRLKKLRELEIWRMETEKVEKWRMESAKIYDMVRPHESLMATLSHNLKNLHLSDIPSLVELPLSIQIFYQLENLKIRNCVNLETLPTGINFEYLESLNLSGCSRLKTFPNISTNIRYLCLEQTGIEEVPWWIWIFSKLMYLRMKKCNNLIRVSLNIYKLRLHVDFSNCKALTEFSWNGSQSELAMALENVHLSGDKSGFYYKFLNLDPEAVLYNRSIIFTSMLLSSEEVPLYFTHQTTGNSLNNIPLHQTFLVQPFLRIRIGAVIFLNLAPGVKIHVSCHFKSKFGNRFDSLVQLYHLFDTTEMDIYLCIFDCRIPLSKDNAPLPELSYDHVDIQFYIENPFSEKTRPTVKGWGIRLLEDFSSEKERLLNPNSLPLVCENNEGYMVDKIAHRSEFENNNVETERIRKRMRVSTKE